MKKIKVLLLIIATGLLLQSCMSTHLPCAAYASNEKTK